MQALIPINMIPIFFTIIEVKFNATQQQLPRELKCTGELKYINYCEHEWEKYNYFKLKKYTSKSHYYQTVFGFIWLLKKMHW